MKWAYGVTTVQSRVGATLNRSLTSLREAGFDSPRLFVDDSNGTPVWPSLEATYRKPRIRTFGNWMLGLAELYIRDPRADRYAIFQDDVIACKRLREYLDKTCLHERCYWNCIAYPDNVKIAQHTGWNTANGAGLGAQGLVFSNEGAMKLMVESNIVVRPKDAGRGHRGIDGGIVFAMKKVGFQELFHFPSLLGHIGVLSSMGNGRQPDIAFDASYDPCEGKTFEAPKGPIRSRPITVRVPFRQRPR